MARKMIERGSVLSAYGENDCVRKLGPWFSARTRPLAMLQSAAGRIVAPGGVTGIPGEN